MFILGLVVGPVSGILLSDFLLARRTWQVFEGGVLAGACLIVFVPFVQPELKCGLLLGFGLGIALAATPFGAVSVPEEA